MAGFNFNPGAYEPMSESAFELFGNGWYKGYISTTNSAGNQAGTGGFIVAEYRVLEGGGMEGKDYVNRFNLWNPNAQAVQIAHRELAAVAWVVGKGTEAVSDVSIAKDMALAVYHNVPFYFLVDTVPQKDRNTKAIIPGKFQNQVRGYRDQWGRTPEQVMANAPQQALPELAGAASHDAGPSLPPAPPIATPPGAPAPSAPAYVAPPAAPAPQPAAGFAPPPAAAPAPAAPAPVAPPAAPQPPGIPHAGPTAPAAPQPPAGTAGWTPGQPPAAGAPWTPPGA
jgi:hypothetical protein